MLLVHGAFADSSSWNGVIAQLRRDGHPVIAAADPLRGLHDDARSLRSVLDSVDGPIVVARHSYGGTVMSEAAHGHPRVTALVYVAGFSPERARPPASWPRCSRVASWDRPCGPCRSPPTTAGPSPTSTSGRTGSGRSSLPTSRPRWPP